MRGSSAWMNSSGPPSSADCHWFDEITICLKLGRIRYSGSSATPSRTENGCWHGKLAAVAMSISTGVSSPRNSSAVCRTGTRGGVKPNHCSSDRLGSSATMRATLASGGAVSSGNRRLRHACWAKTSIGSTSLRAW